MLEENIPKFLVELGQKIQDAGMTYDAWILEHREELIGLAEQYLK